MTDCETAGDAFGEAAEALTHTLTDRLQRLEASGAGMRMDADAFGGTVIDRDEHGGLAFAGERRRQIGPLHGVHCLGDDGAVMAARATRCAETRRCQQIMCPHQPQHPPP